MEEEDEFGDLYTDVLRPFQPSTAPQPLPVQPKQLSPNRPLDPNVQSDDVEILSGAPNSDIKFNFAASRRSHAIAFKYEKASPEEPGVAGSSDSRLSLSLRGKQEDQAAEKKEGLDEGVNNSAYDFSGRSVSRVLESGGGVELQGTGFENRGLMDESGIEVVVEEMNDKDDMLVEKDKVSMEKKENFDKFDIEEVDTGTGDMDPEPVIPGVSADNQGGKKFGMRDEASEDWDSDSEDDLQIVLNGPMGMDKTGAMGSEDEDEDGDPLVIVGDSGLGHQPMEEQEWGDDAAQAVDGDKKELGDAAKMNGGVAVAPKIGYSNHTYHQFHSQFKVSDIVRVGFCVFPLFDEILRCNVNCNHCTPKMIISLLVLWKLVCIKLIVTIIYDFSICSLERFE